MSRVATVFIGIVLLCVPLLSSADAVSELQDKINALLAQIKVLQERIAGTPPASTPIASSATALTACPVISRTLAVGARGDDVTQLQLFLKARGYFNEEETGYFGILTETAVRRMQAAHNIVSSGTAQTTGYGMLGPRTRTLVSELCRTNVAVSGSAVATTTAAIQCPAIAPELPTASSCAGTWEKLTSLGCHIGWRCVLTFTTGNKLPVISSIDGPSTLALDAFGTWKIQAIDPEQGALSYSVTWGDEAIEDILRAIAGLGGTYTQVSSIVHSYAKAGIYTPQVSVRDSAGNTAAATISVRVTADAAGSSADYWSSINAPATTTLSASCVTPWGAQIVAHAGSSYWQPYFTEGSYFATTTPIMRCDNGSWQKCDSMGMSCQAYVAATSTNSGAALRSYSGTIGSSCPSVGATLDVSVPPGTQLCQWLSCTITTEVQTTKLQCTDGGWTDFIKN